MSDFFSSFSDSVMSPCRRGVAVSPDDNTDLVFMTKEVQATGAGNISVLMADSIAPITIPFAAGEVRAIRVRRVRSTGTTPPAFCVRLMPPGIGAGIGPGWSRPRRTGGGGGAAVAGTSATTFALAPTVHYHPNAQTATLDGSNRVLSCPDLRGLAPLSGLAFGGATVGPVQLTDALGRKFWRFEGASYLLVSNALAALSARGVMVLATMRHHRALTGNWFSPRYSAYTDDTINTTYSGGSTLRSIVAASSAPQLFGAGINSASARHITGSQMQVIGVASRTTANGGQRIYVNNDAVNVAQSGATSTACVGGVIGGIPAASNAVTASGNMDLYELAIWNGVLTDAQSDAAAAAMVANFNIPAIVNSLLLEGDSITQGTGAVTSGINIAMLMTAPGGAFNVPPSYRVVNQAISGNRTADIVTRRDAANGAAALPIPGGRNIVVAQIGRNDLAAGTAPNTGAAIYAAITAMYNTTTTGFLQRGWEVRSAVNIAVGSGIETENNIIRSSLRNTAQFQLDTLSNTGNTYEGRTGIIDLPLWTVLGDRIFDTSTDATDTNWYAGDSTHPNAAGAVEMAKAIVAGMAL